MSVQEWLMYTDKKDTLPYLLSDAGYDVWVGNNRGTVDFSRHETLDPIGDAAKYWNFTFVEMGRYDLEAEISFIKSLTGVSKMIFIGYGEGSTQAFYGLATRRDFWKSSISDVIALGPCFIIRNWVKDYTSYFDQFKRANITTIYGQTWEEDYERLCGADTTTELCSQLKDYRARPQPISVKDLKLQA